MPASGGYGSTSRVSFGADVRGDADAYDAADQERGGAGGLADDGRAARAAAAADDDAAARESWYTPIAHAMHEAGETVSHFAVLERLRAQSEVARGVSFGFSGGEHYAKLPLVGLAWPELKDALKRVVNYRGHLRHVFVRPIKGPDHFRALDGVRALATSGAWARASSRA